MQLIDQRLIKIQRLFMVLSHLLLGGKKTRLSEVLNKQMFVDIHLKAERLPLPFVLHKRKMNRFYFFPRFIGFVLFGLIFFISLENYKTSAI